MVLPPQVTHKRSERSSPCPSPMKLTRSPLPKLQRRHRTGTEKQQQKPKAPTVFLQPPTHPVHPATIRNKTLKDFVLSESETAAVRDLQQEVNTYMFHKLSVSNSTVQHPFINLQDYFSLIKITHTQKSRVVYLDVMDAKADSKDTVMELLHDLRKQFIENLNQKWLVVEGDGKFYEILKSLQFEYGEELSWVIPYPGDWHMLKNYQAA